MFTTTTRGRLQAAGALMISIMLIWAVALFGGSTASAQSQPVPAETPVTITKLSQPGTLEKAATGEALETLPDGAQAINGVVFDYYLLPGYDMGTNKGQEDAAALTVAPAVTGDATGFFTATSPAGETTKTLERGLYVVVERASTVPAGVTASAPFLLTVPMTDPTNLNAWLDQIYVYPKNSRITVTKTVENATDYVVGDTVTWTAEAGIPRIENPDYDGTNDDKFIAPDSFRIDEVFNNTQINLKNGYTAGNNPDIVVTAGTETLVEGTDYTITPIDTGGYRIELTPDGLPKLATQVNDNPNAKIIVTIDTTVLTPGQITSTTDVYPNANAVTQEEPARASAEIRYGNYNFQKRSSDNTASLAGAEFRVYATLDDAEKGQNPLAPEGGGHNEGIWTTDATGHIEIKGLRNSNWSNGVSVSDDGSDDGSEDGYVAYYLVETKALKGHQLLAAPVRFEVTAETGVTSPDWVADREIINQANTGAFVLPLTGGSGTAMLTIAGIAILAVVLFVARRRSAA